MAQKPQEVLIGKVDKDAEATLTRKERIMNAQRGDKRVEAVAWVPATMPRGGDPAPNQFILPKSKVVTAKDRTVDDALVAYAATPKQLFDAAVSDLAHRSANTRAMAFNTLVALASEGSHSLSCESRYFVGECCLYGRGTGRDAVRAARWFQTVRPVAWPRGLVNSPANAMAQAQFLLGDLFEFGGIGSGAGVKGTEPFHKDPHKAMVRENIFRRCHRTLTAVCSMLAQCNSSLSVHR